jgi:hypothetical protein
MRRGKNAELILKDTLTLYGEVLALGRDWVELEGQVVGLRVLAQVARGFIWGRDPKEEGEVGGLGEAGAYRVLSRILWVKHGGRNGPRGAQEVDQGGDGPAHPGRGQGRH